MILQCVLTHCQLALQWGNACTDIIQSFNGYDFPILCPKKFINYKTCPTYTSASRDGNSVLIVASDIKEVPHLRNLLIENWKHTMYNLSTTTTTQSRTGIYSYIDPSGEWEGEAEGLSVNNSLYVDVPFDLQFNVNARIIR